MQNEKYDEQAVAPGVTQTTTQAAQFILQEISRLAVNNAHTLPIIVAIDGRCASGKTTLAAYLQQTGLQHPLGADCTTDCTVLPMDHFFLQPAQRTAERLREPGGNVDYERFLHEVLLPLRRGEGCTYRPYDCQQQAMGEPIICAPRPVYIVEGTYACHPVLYDYYDLRIFLTVDAEEQRRRIVVRNGEAQAAVFQTRWIPLEEHYFAAYDIKKRCAMCIDTGQR